MDRLNGNIPCRGLSIYVKAGTVRGSFTSTHNSRVVKELSGTIGRVYSMGNDSRNDLFDSSPTGSLFFFFFVSSGSS